MDEHRPPLTPRRDLNSLPRWFLATLAAGPVVLLGVFYVWPLGTLLDTVVNGTTIRRALHLPGLGRVLWFTFWQAALSTLLTVAAALLPAFVLARYRFPGRSVVRAVVTVPFMLPTVVVGAAFAALLPQSWHGSARAIIAAHVFFNIAVVVRLCGDLWAALPDDLTGAARTLGATPWQTARHVVLPLLRPSLVASSTVVFLFCFTSFGVIRVLGSAANPTLEVLVAQRATGQGDVGTAAVLAVFQLAMLAVLVLLSTRLQRRTALAFSGRASARHVRSAGDRWLVGTVVAVTVAAIGVPLAALARRSFDLGGGWSVEAWRQLISGSAEVRPGVSLGVDALASVRTSLVFAAVATVLSTALGALAAWTITATRRSGRLLDVGTMLPLGTSAVTVGLGMLITFDAAPFDWRASWWLIPVGHSLIAVPFVVRALVPVLRAIPADRRNAAAVLGASPLRAYVAISVRPLARPLVTAAGFAAAISLGEFGATTFLTRAGRQTMPIAIDKLLGRAGAIPRAQGFALATLLMVVTALVVVATGVEGRERA